MRPTQHPSNNPVLGAPADWRQDELPCSALAVTVDRTQHPPTVTSYWRPSAEELQAIINGGLIALTIVGHTMPPVAIEVSA